MAKPIHFDGLVPASVLLGQRRQIVLPVFMSAVFGGEWMWKFGRTADGKAVTMWYVIQTMAGQEEIVKLMLEKYLPGDSYEACRILYYVRKKRYRGEWHEVKERLLPGYLFLVAESPWPAWQALKRVTKFSRLLRNYEENVIYPIAKDEEAFLRRIAGDKDEVELSYGVIEGDKVKIISGSLTGMEAVIRRIDRHKRVAYIEMAIFGESKLVQVGLEVVAKEKTGELKQFGHGI